MAQILQKGANISLTKIAPNCNEIIINIKWLKKSNDETEFDIDASAFMLNEYCKIRSDADFIFYNQPKSADNAIELMPTQASNSQSFKVILNRIANNIVKFSIVLTMHEAKERQQNFGMLGKITVEILNAINKMELVFYTLQEVDTETALILGDLYRYNGEWKFKAIGQGYSNGLDVLAKNYGVNIGAAIENSPPEIKIQSSKNPTIMRYIEAIKPNIEKIKNKAKKAKDDNLNESGTRIIIDTVLQNILGYQLQHIKTEQRIPNRQLRIDYLLSLDGKNIMVVEAKPINQKLGEKYISQVVSYAFFLKLDFALLTNGIEWKLYYVIPKKYVKYEYHHVFSINLLEFNDTVAERLYSVSRFGITEKSLEVLKSKMTTLNNVAEIILLEEVIETIAKIMNNKNLECQVTTDEVRTVIENNILSLK